MTRLPTVSGDSNTWGTVLNQFLQVGHNASGSTSNGMPVFNVKDDAYGALGDGSTDDTTAIQAAITAAQSAGGGVVFVPPVSTSYIINNTLTISANNVQIVGAGWASQIQAGASMPAAPMLQSQAIGGGAFRYGIKIQDIYFNGNNVTGVGGIQLDTTYHALLDHVRVRNCKAISVYLNGTSGNVGAYTNIIGCTITDGTAATSIGVLTTFHEWITIVGGLIGTFNTAGGVGVKYQNLNCRLIGVGLDNCDTNFWQVFAGRTTILGCQFDRAQTRHMRLQGAKNCAITGNAFCSRNGSGTDMINIDDGANASNIFSGNSTLAGQGWTNWIKENANTGTPGNLYVNNDCASYAVVQQTGIFKNNLTYNPVGHAVTQPGVAASTVAMTNTTGVDCMVIVTGGTVSNITVGGTATGITLSTGQIVQLRVPAGQTWSYTYTVAPTHSLYGD